jgi:hypothetical protein
MTSKTQIYDPDGDVTLILDEEPHDILYYYSEVADDSDSEETHKSIKSEGNITMPTGRYILLSKLDTVTNAFSKVSKRQR